eukprot:2157192-Pleurochrysis_carterae.AAC.1
MRTQHAHPQARAVIRKRARTPRAHANARVLTRASGVAQADASEEAEAAARVDAETFMLHGMDRAELEKMMMTIFQKADTDGSGSLGLAEFHNCIKEADLGFTRKEVNTLMHSVDLSNDGEVSYAERS